MFESIEKSYKSIMNDENKGKKIGFGILSVIGSIFIIPAFLYQGYIIRILKQTDKGLPMELPKWNNKTGLLKDGFIGLFIGLIISLPGIIPNIFSLFVNDQFILYITLSLAATALSAISSYISFGILTVGFRDGFSEITDLDRMLSLFISEEYFIGFISVMSIGALFGIMSFFFFITIVGIPVVFILMIPFGYLNSMIIGNAVTQAESDSLNL